MVSIHEEFPTRLDAILNGRESIDVLRACCTPEVYERVAMLVGMYRNAFPNGRVVLESVNPSSAGDLTTFEIRGRGIHEGMLMGLPATQREVTLRAACKYRTDATTVLELSLAADSDQLLTQLAPLLPEPGQILQGALAVAKAAMAAWTAAVVDGDAAQFESLCEADATFSLDAETSVPGRSMLLELSVRDAQSFFIAVREAFERIDIVGGRWFGQGNTLVFQASISYTSRQLQHTERANLMCLFGISQGKIVEHSVRFVVEENSSVHQRQTTALHG